jgi:hypothetical protein
MEVLSDGTTINKLVKVENWVCWSWIRDLYPWAKERGESYVLGHLQSCPTAYEHATVSSCTHGMCYIFVRWHIYYIEWLSIILACTIVEAQKFGELIEWWMDSISPTSHIFNAHTNDQTSRRLLRTQVGLASPISHGTLISGLPHRLLDFKGTEKEVIRRCLRQQGAVVETVGRINLI